MTTTLVRGRGPTQNEEARTESDDYDRVSDRNNNSGRGAAGEENSIETATTSVRDNRPYRSKTQRDRSQTMMTKRSIRTSVLVEARRTKKIGVGTMTTPVRDNSLGRSKKQRETASDTR